MSDLVERGAIARHIAATDVEAFAWLLDLEFCHGEEAEEAKNIIVSALTDANKAAASIRELETQLDEHHTGALGATIKRLVRERDAIAAQTRAETIERCEEAARQWSNGQMPGCKFPSPEEAIRALADKPAATADS